MDEPFGAVDPIVRANLQDELISLQSRLRKTIVLVTHDIDEAIKLGDRVAILSTGGHLEQYDTPAEILRNPANEFVADFLGSDRGIKRLSLIPIAAIKLDPGPILPRTATRAAAAEVMARYEIDWGAIGDDTTIEGWFKTKDLQGHDTLEHVKAREFQVKLSPTNSLREALDAIMTSQTAVAAVFDGDRYLGMATVDEISREIVQ
jgi:osmoprotectant transport system ATP-binding protein